MKFLKWKMILCFFLIPISFSCGEDEEEKSESKGNGLGDAAVGSITSNSGVTIPTILSESDLSKPSDLSELSLTDLLSHLNDSDKLYVAKDESDDDSSSEGGDGAEGIGAAFEELFKCYFKDVVTDGQMDYVLVSGKLNGTSCSGSDESLFPDVTLVSFIGCKGFDFSGFNGDLGPNEEAEKAVAEQSCSEAEEFDQDISSSKLTFTVDNQSYTQEKDSKSETADSKGGTCKMTVENGQKTYVEKCIYREIENTAGESLGGSVDDKQYYEVSYAEGLKVPASGTSDQWFNDGQVNVVLNNWTVTLTYTNSSTPPSYSATNGTDTETGSLDEKTDFDF